MAFRILPKKDRRLRDGSMGTQFDAMKEQLGILLTRRQMLEDEIELLRIQMQTADGATL